MQSIPKSKSKSKQATFYVPVSLRPSLIPRGQRQYAAYLLNLLHWRWICWQADEHGYIRLSSRITTRIIPRDMWRPLLNLLIDLGVVECDLKTAKGKKCRGYRIVPGYRKTRRIVCTDEKINEKIAKLQRERKLLPVHRWLADHLDTLSIDLDKATSIIETLEPEQDSIEEYRSKLIEHCKIIHNRDSWFEVDKYGRCHTAVTNLPKELRPCLSVNNQPLVNIDLANSQPLIAGMVAASYYRERTAALRLMERRFLKKGNPYHRRKLHPVGELPEDLRAYLDICQQGQIYETLMRPGEDREQMKRAFLTVLYSKNHWKSKLKSRFEAMYPSVAKMLRDLKRRNHAHASHVMQNAESTIIIHAICGRLMREHPRMPVFTIHDSILTEPRFAETVQKIIEEEFLLLGISPKLKKE